MTIAFLTEEEIEAGVPSPLELGREFPLRDEHLEFVARSRETIRKILCGKDPRLLMVVGPCSIHDPVAAFEYAVRMKKLALEVEESCFLVMRAYFEKPRTSKGWKGLLFDPHLDGSHDMAHGLRLARKLLIQLAELAVPAATEFLEINTALYLSELISWGCIGARTTTSQPHRQLAAMLPIPIGFKNTTDGNVEHAVQAVRSASSPHTFLGLSPSGQVTRVQTDGNHDCHIVLRGGESSPNYDPGSISKAIEQCENEGIHEKILIDCSHGNCQKVGERQADVFHEVLRQIRSGNRKIAGMMLESHLSGGMQRISKELVYGVSITDPCLGWEATESLVREAAFQR